MEQMRLRNNVRHEQQCKCASDMHKLLIVGYKLTDTEQATDVQCQTAELSGSNVDYTPQGQGKRISGPRPSSKNFGLKAKA